MLWKFFWNHQKNHAIENHVMENHVRRGPAVSNFNFVVHNIYIMENEDLHNYLLF